ncbi:hypothetical protein AVEN_87280-1 [Araneus ventricosus]|uniref:Uncharacterized protein n=1 Tax=Araneus ventricosus TaxID=182803 RepID=A0A4Y2EDJ6_ARAVE|nr:hypothetical protein AVEN_87280-1 [Araneus ventricosus]
MEISIEAQGSWNSNEIKFQHFLRRSQFEASNGEKKTKNPTLRTNGMASLQKRKKKYPEATTEMAQIAHVIKEVVNLARELHLKVDSNDVNELRPRSTKNANGDCSLDKWSRLI